MFAKSPRSGVTIRQRQSSVMTDTHQPVSSIGAAARAVGCGCGAPRGAWACAVDTIIAANAMTVALRGDFCTSINLRDPLVEQARVHRFDEHGRRDGRRWILEV